MECRHFDSEGTRGEKQRHGGEALGEAAQKMLLYSKFLHDLIFVPHVKCAALAKLTATLPLFGDGSPLHYDASHQTNRLFGEQTEIRQHGCWLQTRYSVLAESYNPLPCHASPPPSLLLYRFTPIIDAKWLLNPSPLLVNYYLPHKSHSSWP
jgi:hypothetical protein